MAGSPEVHLDLVIDDKDIFTGAKEILKTLRPQWEPERIKFKEFSEGITNTLIGCYEESDKEKDDCIVIRVYGKNTELMIDREIEKCNMRILHSVGCASKLYATFTNGLAYGFVQGECLDEHNVREPHIGRLIAKAMVQMHSADLAKVAPLNNSVKAGPDREPCLFKKSRKFLSLVPDSYDDPVKNNRFKKEMKSREELSKELDMLEKHLVPLGSPVAFCHNDILLKNIVYNKKKEQAFFIDFEYGAYNYTAYDIGNHFAEWAGVETVDYSLWPDKATQLPWLRGYLELWYEATGCKASDVTDRDVEVLYVQANAFSLMAHFFWGLWALIQAKHSIIDFDYLDYAVIRFNEYFAKKDELLALKLPD